MSYIKDEAIQNIVSKLCENDLLDRVQLFIDGLNQQEKLPAQYSLVNALSQKHKFDEAMAVVHQMPEGYKREAAMKAIFNNLASTGQITKGIKLAESLTKEEERFDMLQLLAFECLKDDLKQAIAIANSLSDIKKIELLARMPSALIRNNDLKGALVVAGLLPQDMRDRILAPIATDLTYDGKYREAGQIAELITDDAEKHPILVKIIESYCIDRKFSEARDVAQDFENQVQKEETLHTISAKEFLSKNELEEAFKESQGITDARLKAEVLKAIITGFCNENNFTRAFEILAWLPTESETVYALREISSLLCSKYDTVSGAPELFDKIAKLSEDAFEGVSEYVKSSFLERVAYRLIPIGKFDKAIVFIRQIPDEYNSKSDLLNRIANSYVEQNNFDQALVYANEIPDPYVKENLLQKGVEKVLDILGVDDAIKFVEKIADRSTQMSVVSNLSKNLCDKTLIDDAIRLVNILTIPFERSQVLAELGERLLLEDKLDSAMRILEAMPEGPQKNGLLRDISKQLHFDNRITEAIDITRKISNDSERFSLLEWMALESCYNDAENDRVDEIALEITDPAQKSDFLSTITEVLMRNGYVKRALEIAEKIPDETMRAEIINRIKIHEFGQQGKFADAIDVAAKITDDDLKSTVLGEIAHYAAVKGDYVQLIRIAKMTTDAGEKANLLYTISNGLLYRSNENVNPPDSSLFDEVYALLKGLDSSVKFHELEKLEEFISENTTPNLAKATSSTTTPASTGYTEEMLITDLVKSTDAVTLAQKLKTKYSSREDGDKVIKAVMKFLKSDLKMNSGSIKALTLAATIYHKYFKSKP